ncbi:cation:proton antiporter [Dolosicoccus paucivorans]|uniref:Potassium transporter n=1 Tax=Dolosicoccus paucivorans TaxID=84521 RepID=A0A1G8K1F7_9LACT|nr:cation:proton antiporter [Dolosicoccus paucivorans]PMB84778.1 potassium transporter [Dolosicoccus paucivorans]PMC58196.1 potassium transporter [Dolosicoccus paucivorans]SDI37254.1 sodium/proton antiporter, CPA1 family [Dolosicoccus paucivorans]
MVLSFALILLIGFIFGKIAQTIKLPGLIGMMVAGILMGPSLLHWIDDTTLLISPMLRQLALIIILMRAGLTLNINQLKKVGRPALLMSFVPATMEIIGVTLFSTWLLGLSLVDGILLGTILAAVSPAVVVPSMIKIIDQKYGTKEGIPQMILAAASIDDIIVIVLFTSVLSIATGSSFNAANLLQIPLQIGGGIGVGLLLGWGLKQLFQRLTFKPMEQFIILFASCLLAVGLENQFNLPISSLLIVMTSCMTLNHFQPQLTESLSQRTESIWQVAQIFLFVLIGAAVEISQMKHAGFIALVVILGALVFRMFGVWLSLLKTPFTSKERLFTMLAYTPKATVQAAIGAIPLASGVPSGGLLLAVAVISILFTAPMGIILIEKTYRKLLTPS